MIPRIVGKLRPFTNIAIKSKGSSLLLAQSRTFRASPLAQTFMAWSELSKEAKKQFIRNYIELYKQKNPCSKSNVMYRALAGDMDVHDDAPYVFGILYNEIRAVQLGISRDNQKGSGGAMGDPDFAALLYK
ncbi:AFR125Cp [Eremothecium gossypii ATCC 10895]|uniref:AFR125Cp n=1 Tax=Eremothecium gossypii (strain ATCC 10895 / CBS 109.51 / FGSC 9923 / NRRL Y-1056) TaxID=284811 RepID=Q754E5_EREGS|nr:AFR125Cp [Eremothecium gossypii ATCC 10895]AAS53496.1 AFR125Cp [Eremothecium gossypii ATCC 10895]AEY97808.1 FAFR125Cp [Eremothecium gossypii FDAG1]